ncbi:RNA-dependent RNA polymerase [Hubei noda-like virus 9]|uniref:RNA-dependent RNA polymerase n=1 Tax=Hubei noda-like virus 9 TaxID=1922989 RepID=UPI000909D58E|nr:RNA-dependent RNA polymerase [Hubei noda-like virus 9]APG76551.1 RNA-dependent RNA polymerase [Hubei noda-like virus 9]
MKYQHEFLVRFTNIAYIIGCLASFTHRYRVIFRNKSAGKDFQTWCRDNRFRLCCYWDRQFAFMGGYCVIFQPIILSLCVFYNLFVCFLVFSQVIMEIACCMVVSFAMDNGLDCIDECSYFIDLFTVEHFGADRDLRSLFDIKRLTSFKPSPHHTHGISAAERTGASRTIREAIMNAGYKPYAVSAASMDQEMGLDGNRSYYWAKDFKPKYQADEITSDHAIMMIDVDYYCDLYYYMCQFRPILMYTLQPNFVSYRSKDYAYYIQNNKIHYDVSGGGKYSHEVWDYDSDTISIVDSFGFNCVYHVVSKTIENPDCPGSGRRLVSLVPLRRVAPFCYKPPGQTLKRKTYTYNGVNIIHDLVAGTVSMCENGTYESVQLSTLEYTALRSIAIRKEKELFKGDVQSILRRRYEVGTAPPYKEFELQTPIIAHLLSKVLDLPINAIATSGIPVKREATAYTALGPDTLNENRFPGQLITSQLASASAILPAKNNNNSCASVVGRLTNVRNTVVPSRIYGSYADEFSKLVVPDALMRKGMPVDLDIVKEHQKRPLQKARIQATEHVQSTDPDNRLTTFIKNEPYASANHPRNITTMAPEFTLALSAWTYAFKEDCLKHLKSYGPGKTPLQSAKLLRDICQNGAVLTDYTRFDGTISEWLQRYVVKRIYQRWSSDPALTNSLFDKIFKQSGVTREGKRFSAFYGTRSGSPTTTDGNTLINMYMCYCALRKLGYNPTQAFSLLGIYAGDDGVSRRIPGFDEQLKIVVVDLGLSVKLEVTDPGASINYLGRIFPDILASLSSHQDMTRTLPKLHISTNQMVTRDQAAYNKAAGYYVTDKLTPILGSWAIRVMAITNCGNVYNETREEEYKRINEAWPQEVRDRQLLAQSVAEQLGLTTPDVLAFDKEIMDVDSLFEFPVIWDNDIEDKINAQIGDDVVIVSNRDSVLNETELRPNNNAIPTTNTNTRRRDRRERNPHNQRPSTSASDNWRSDTAGTNEAGVSRSVSENAPGSRNDRSATSPLPRRPRNRRAAILQHSDDTPKPTNAAGLRPTKGRSRPHVPTSRVRSSPVQK